MVQCSTVTTNDLLLLDISFHVPEETNKFRCQQHHRLTGHCCQGRVADRLGCSWNPSLHEPFSLFIHRELKGIPQWHQTVQRSVLCTAWAVSSAQGRVQMKQSWQGPCCRVVTGQHKELELIRLTVSILLQFSNLYSAVARVGILETRSLVQLKQSSH